MIDVNWDLAPEGAKELRELIGGQFLRWFNGDGKAWDGYKWFNSIDEYKTIATRPTQTKTVAESSQKSCLEEGEKWTHECSGEKCKYVVREVDSAGYVIVLGEDGEYYRQRAEDVKPIKPTISASELLDKIRERAISIDDDDELGAKVRAWLDEHDII